MRRQGRLRLMRARDLAIALCCVVWQWYPRTMARCEMRIDFDILRGLLNLVNSMRSDINWLDVEVDLTME